MGLFSNAEMLSVEDAARDYAQILLEGEKIEAAYRLVRDVILLTDRRYLSIDKQGLRV